MFLNKNKRITIRTRVIILILAMLTITVCYMVFTAKYSYQKDYYVNLLDNDKRQLDVVWFYEDGTPAIYGDSMVKGKDTIISTYWSNPLSDSRILSLEICEQSVQVLVDGWRVFDARIEGISADGSSYKIADQEVIFINIDDMVNELKTHNLEVNSKNPHVLTFIFNSDSPRNKIPTIFVQSEVGALSGAVKSGYLELTEFVVLMVTGIIFFILFLVYYLNKIDEALGFLLLSLFTVITAIYSITNSNIVSILGWSSIKSTYAEYIALILMMIPAALYVSFTCRSYKKSTFFSAAILFFNLYLQLILYGLNIYSLTEMTWITGIAFLIQTGICMVALFKEWVTYKTERSFTNLCANIVLDIMLFYEILHRIFLDESSRSHYFPIGLMAYIAIIAANTLKQNVTMSADNMSLQLYKKLSLEDSMTGLGSRAAYEIFLIEKGNSKLTDKEMAVLFVDINDLKKTNDIQGHAAGDRLIKAVSGILNEVTKESGAETFRIGGDEFVMIVGDKQKAEIIPLQIRNMLSEHNKRQKVDYSVAIGLSTGVIGKKNPYGEGICTMSELVKEADRRMYKDKNEYKASQKA